MTRDEGTHTGVIRQSFRESVALADENGHGWIKALGPEHPGESKPFAGGQRTPADLRFSEHGSLYVLLRNAWVRDDQFPAGTGSLLRIQCTKAAR